MAVSIGTAAAASRVSVWPGVDSTVQVTPSSLIRRIPSYQRTGRLTEDARSSWTAAAEFTLRPPTLVMYLMAGSRRGSADRQDRTACVVGSCNGPCEATSTSRRSNDLAPSRRARRSAAVSAGIVPPRTVWVALVTFGSHTGSFG